MADELNLNALKSYQKYDAYSYFKMLKALLPRGLVWCPYLGNEPESSSFFGNLLYVVAKEFNRLNARFVVLMNEAIPGLSNELLAEWEEFAGLPEECFTGIFINNLSYDLILGFNAWSKGNGLVDKNIGNMPSWKGLYQCSFENCGVGFGFVNNGNDGHLNLDGVAAY
ncbi:unnamed protein product, partial [marine sediment metagenome]